MFSVANKVQIQSREKYQNLIDFLGSNLITASLEKYTHRMIHDAKGSLRISTHVYLFCPLFPAGGFFSWRSCPPVSKPANAGLYTTNVKPADAMMLGFLKLNSDVCELPNSALRLPECLFVVLNPNVESPTLLDPKVEVVSNPPRIWRT